MESSGSKSLSGEEWAGARWPGRAGSWGLFFFANRAVKMLMGKGLVDPGQGRPNFRVTSSPAARS